MRGRNLSAAPGLEDGRGRARTSASLFVLGTVAFGNCPSLSFYALNPRRMDPPKCFGTEAVSICFQSLLAGSSRRCRRDDRGGLFAGSSQRSGRGGFFARPSCCGGLRP